MKHRLPVLTVVLFLLFPLPALAQPSLSSNIIAETYESKDTEIQTGDVISLAADGTIERSKVPYDKLLFGVVDFSPTMVIRHPEKTIPVIRSGSTTVNITTVNGPIAVGDYITSSEIPGKGQKATDVSGFTLGRALSPLSEADGTAITFNGKTVRAGTINITLGIGPGPAVQAKGSTSFFGSLAQAGIGIIGTIRTSEETDRLVRMVLAGFVAVATIFINFNTFGRNVTKGIESIGRNPLARVAIQSMILVNVMLIAIVSIGGIVLSLAILNL